MRGTVNIREEMGKAIKRQRSMDEKVEDFEDGEMQIRKMGTKRESKRKERAERKKKQRWEKAKTEGSSDCCNDYMQIVRSRFQLDFI